MSARCRSVIAGAALCVLSLAPPGHAQSPAQNPGMDRMNEEIQDLWTRLRPAFEARLIQEAHTRLAGLSYRAGPAEVELDEVRHVRLDLAAAPGLHHLAWDRLVVAVPRAGDWAIEIEAKVKVRIRLGFVRSTFKIPVELRVRHITAVCGADFDVSDPARPVVRRVEQPRVDFRLRLRSSAFFYNLLLSALSPLGDRLAHKALDDALRDLAPTLASLQGLPGPVPADGAPPLADSGASVPWDEVVGNVDRKLRRDHLPHGTLLRATMDTPAHDSWLDAYRAGGPGNVGTVVAWPGGGDSAIFTGMYLASQALRFAATGDPDAQDNVRHAVWGIGNLLDVTGGRGLLARVAAPASSSVGQELVANWPNHYQAVLHGESWVGRTDQGHGGKGISRDQYSGVFFGLATAHDAVTDPALKAECARRIAQMLDYLVAEGWFIDEDRPAFDLTTGGGFPTFWLGVACQKLAFLHAGERAHPGRYAAELQREGPLASTAWLGMWGDTWNLDSYFKFNLLLISVYSYFRLETEPSRWQDMHRAYRMVQRYVGHHRNPHFDLIQTSIDPSLQATLFPGVRQQLRRFVLRNHREVAAPVVDLSGVTWVTLSLPGVSVPGRPHNSQPITLPSEPLDALLQEYTSFFLWQRSPFKPAQAGTGNPRDEMPGLDLVLPYWMGRHQGAF